MDTPNEDFRNPTPDDRSETDPVGTGRRLFAELLGTFALTAVAAGGEVVNAVSHGEVSAAARAVAPGLVVMAFIYTVGEVSGAHFNPAVTLAFAVRGVFPWRRVPAYWLAEFAGAISAAVLLRSLFGNVAELGVTRTHYGTGTGLMMEIVLTWLLVMVILGTACEKGLVGSNAALAVGATIALCGLFAAPISGASMNPARSLGPAIIAGATSGQWIYLVGPVAGALLAVGCTWVLHGFPSASEEEAARGAADGERERSRPAVRLWRAAPR
jgi:aquaporin Z